MQTSGGECAGNKIANHRSLTLASGRAGVAWREWRGLERRGRRVARREWRGLERSGWRVARREWRGVERSDGGGRSERSDGVGRKRRDGRVGVAARNLETGVAGRRREARRRETRRREARHRRDARRLDASRRRLCKSKKAISIRRSTGEYDRDTHRQRANRSVAIGRTCRNLPNGANNR